MTRDQIIEVITQVVGDELTLMRQDVERLVASKPLPPFTPPPVWSVGRHSASVLVRHANGMFMARRDTESEPPGDDWLPLLVGVAGLDLRMDDDRTVALRARLSDGQQYEMVRTLAVPIMRGYWSPDVDYWVGDRVIRYGEFHALVPSKGVEPGTEGSDAAWLKVGGKPKPALQLALDDDGNMTESGHIIGTIKPMVRGLLADLFDKRK